jgi:hypothetical protein
MDRIIMEQLNQEILAGNKKLPFAEGNITERTMRIIPQNKNP